MQHPLIDDLNWRYAAKKYDPSRKLTATQLGVIREALRLAPSSRGLQPYKFILIGSEAVKQELVAASHGQQMVADASHLVVFCVNKNMGASFVAEYLEQVSTVREVPLDNLDRYRQHLITQLGQMSSEQQMEWAARQAYIALGQLVVSAAHLKIDATPLEGFEPDEYNRLLKLDQQGLHAVVACALGFRSADDGNQHLKKIRRNEDDLFIEIP